MAWYLVLWRRNLALWPTDPRERAELMKKIGGTFVDGNIKKGKIKEHGHFLNGNSGYSIWEADAIDVLKNMTMTMPYYEFEVHEFIPYEKSKAIVGSVFEIPAESAKK
jgi:hypothetical protein